MTAEAQSSARRLSRRHLRFCKAFLSALTSPLPANKQTKSVLAHEIQTKADSRWRTEPVKNADPVTSGHHWAACLVIEADRAFCDLLPSTEARLDATKAALIKPDAAALRFFMRLMLVFSRDRFNSLTAYTEHKVPPQYGPAFTFETVDASDDRFVQAVKTCFYKDYFRAAGAPHLTAAFCAFNTVWINEIDPARDGIEFRRPTTLAAGDTACRFEFSQRTAD